MAHLIEQVALLLFVAAVVAMIAQRFRFPYAVGLVITGLCLRFLPVGPPLQLTRDLLFTTLLPPLIFEAAIFLPWRTLRGQMPLVMVLATLGVVVAAAVTGYSMYALRGWPLVSALTFGALIAATDPVSVIAAFREFGVPARLRLLVEAESLFNDGTAAVLFGAAVAFGTAASATVGGVAANLLLGVVGGIACGVAVAVAARFLAGRTNDPLVEITFTVVAAYGSFLLAEHIGGSGVVATLAAGLVLGGRDARKQVSPRSRVTVEAFWEFVAFAANSLIFLLIGIEEVQQNFSGLLPSALVAVLVVTLGRAATVYPISALFARSRLRVPAAHQHGLFWGGLRGALALALALGLPPTIPLREEIVSVTFAVVAFSIVVQGLTLPALLRRLGLDKEVRSGEPEAS